MAAEKFDFTESWCAAAGIRAVEDHHSRSMPRASRACASADLRACASRTSGATKARQLDTECPPRNSILQSHGVLLPGLRLSKIITPDRCRAPAEPAHPRTGRPGRQERPAPLMLGN